VEIIQEIKPMKKTDSTINSEGSDADEEAVRRSSAQSREKYRLKEECLTEFQTLMLDKLVATFKKMDENGDGFITVEEFKNFYEKESNTFNASRDAFEFVLNNADDVKGVSKGKEQFLNAYGFEKPALRRVSSPLLEQKEDKED